MDDGRQPSPLGGQPHVGVCARRPPGWKGFVRVVQQAKRCPTRGVQNPLGPDDEGGPVSQPTGLLPAATFPPLAWFHRAQRSGVEVCVHEHYVKQSLRNRVALVGPEGPFDLSLPVHRRGASTRSIRDVLFTDRVEPNAFLRVLQTNCGRAPFFDHLLPEVEAWAHEHLVPGAPLLEASLASTRWACHWLGMTHPPVTQTYHEH
ncbi:MAG TPA: hypothetical protein DCX49_01940, partial [Flavobacteriales bacterium]|nr:hypothetical protein [Flavobacteriales bacterium]